MERIISTLIILPHVYFYLYRLWQSFAADPGASSGIFSMFPDTKSKLEHYNISGVITSAFAHVALLPAYRLSYYESRTKIPLQVTPEIIGGIMSGAISMWNDTLIQAANPLTKTYLPYVPVVVAVRSTACDANELLIHYLMNVSPTFNKRYAATNMTVAGNFNLSSLIPSSRLLIAASNSEVDAFVATSDGTFGYYWLKAKVNTLSSIANFCQDPVCSTGPIDPRKEASVLACRTNATVINPTKYLHTYDLTSSVAAGCYPLAGTVDYSILGTTNPLTCRSNGTAIAAVLRNRIKFSSWIFSSPVVVKPLVYNNVYASSAAHRASTYTTICDIQCGGSAYGYKYCGYEDCMWSKGDFVQTVHQCDPELQTISVTYSLKPDRVCILNPRTAPVSGTEIPCSDVLKSYRYGKIASALAVLGMSVTAIVMIFVYLNRHEKVIKKSQPIFIYIFIAGAFFMNLSIFAYIGPNTDSSCLLRPWCVNITSTIMFAPLLAKLHRIDMLFRLSKKMKKTKISDLTVSIKRVYFSSIH
jgi:7 transmembrane sweet-taste receptor of 3 GCPR